MKYLQRLLNTKPRIALAQSRHALYRDVTIIARLECLPRELGSRQRGLGMLCGLKEVGSRHVSACSYGGPTGMKKVLNVGGNSKEIPLPPEYAEFEHLLLDIDPRGKPDVLCDARELNTLRAAEFDAIYCSHNLEHYYRHEVPVVLGGFLHLLKVGGFAHIKVPDLQQVMRLTIERGLDIDDVLYESPAGPIMVLDVLYGLSVEIESSGQDFFAHKTGFTPKSLQRALLSASFSPVYVGAGNLEVHALAFKGTPDPDARALFNLPDPQ